MIITPERDAIVQAARGFLGVPFCHLGRSHMGIDCAGLLDMTAQAIGYPAQGPRAYSNRPHQGELQRELSKCFNRIKLKRAQPGDILLINFASQPSHIGIKTDIGLIHAYQPLGKVVEHSIDSKWARRLVAAYTWRPHG